MSGVRRAALALAACAFWILSAASLSPASAAASTYARYTRYGRYNYGWGSILVPIFIISAVLIGFFVFSLTPWGREMMRRRTRRGMFDTDMIGMYPGTIAAEPLKKVKGIFDCPQCGLEVTPGMTKCPKCHWNLHTFQTQAAGAPTGAAPVDLAGFGAVAMAPLMAAADTIPSTPTKSTVLPGVDVADPQTAASAVRDDDAVPAAPDEPSTPVVFGVVQHDILIDGVVAFKEGARIPVEAEDPDPMRPEYKYVVTSQVLGKKFRLSDLDVFT